MGQDYVKGGGTSTSAQDQRLAMERAEAEKRRSYQDSVQGVAKADPAHARLYSHKFGGISDNASIVLKVEYADRTTRGYLMCDLLAEEHDGEPGWLLLIPCPVCYYDRHEPVSNCTMTLRSWHRRFSLDPKHQGVLWVSPLQNSEGHEPEACTLAGSIYTHETQTCPKCAYRFEIGAARLDAGELPVSGSDSIGQGKAMTAILAAARALAPIFSVTSVKSPGEHHLDDGESHPLGDSAIVVEILCSAGSWLAHAKGMPKAELLEKFEGWAKDNGYE